MDLFLVIQGLLVITLLRGTLFWARFFQLREYRIDRIKAYFQTKDARKSLIPLLPLPGIFPRPNITLRSSLIILGSILIEASIFILLTFVLSGIWSLLIVNILVGSIVFFTSLILTYPAKCMRRYRYNQAQKIRKKAKNLTVIAITGSYGKSSTKKILASVFTDIFSKENVLFVPENNNTELAIANFIRKHESFFKKKEPRFFIVEIGAYAVGEIALVCNFIKPDIAILTGINDQHIELFGSKENIITAKLELAEAASDAIFYNGDSPVLENAIKQRNFHAKVYKSSLDECSEREIHLFESSFIFQKQKYVLHWSGGFFQENALLCIHAGLYLGSTPQKLSDALSDVPPPKNALHTKTLPNGATLFYDLYSANPSGVFSAIEHLNTVSGEKIFVGIPLRELGDEAESIHTKLFTLLKEKQISVFWLLDDFSELGKEILGDLFFGKDLDALKEKKENLDKNAGILLESRLPTSIVKLFRNETRI